jgi:endogenous inhibitor of DNA gyrase (YacG/DUF329 family)
MDRKCPTCRRTLGPGAMTAPHRPFCSERCRTADLGSWLDAAYRIGSPVTEEDLDQGLGGDDLDSESKTPQ